uniref:Uncharacterized protein n=1 Tax=Arundo donax TaxID=35708 RepID=A0A0A9GQR4_ARUDO
MIQRTSRGSDHRCSCKRHLQQRGFSFTPARSGVCEITGAVAYRRCCFDLVVRLQVLWVTFCNPRWQKAAWCTRARKIGSLLSYS